MAILLAFQCYFALHNMAAGVRPSIDLHKKCGFRKIGVRERLVKISNGVWYGVVLMEHRSKLVGIN
ncbi:hypothetical protein [Clostridium autoethanogenum]|uniref:hypothetical protein n=1 Tax=Clostridium autoethanogenum TaxID=84023 RepID=UPI00267D6376